jgi:hypothetical protein
MPHKQDESRIVAVPLHDTFAAEVRGVDFSKELSDEDFNEVYKAITKVNRSLDHATSSLTDVLLASMAW